MCKVFAFVLVFAISLFPQVSESTHFMGVSLVSDIYMDTNSSEEVVQVFYRLIWKTNSLSSRYLLLKTCDPGPCTETWQNIGIGTEPSCQQTVIYENDQFGGLLYDVTIGNKAETRYPISRIPPTGTVVCMSFSSNSWGIITTADFGAEICLLTAPRLDNGLFNQTPRSPISPIVELQPGAGGYNFTIPTADPDGDIVRCRWSNDTTECQDACADTYTDPNMVTGIPFSLTSECRVTYTGGDVTNCEYYPICVQLEDYYVSKPTIMLSSAPLQFIVGICPQSTPSVPNSLLIVDNCSTDLANEKVASSSSYSAPVDCSNNLHIENAIIPSNYSKAVNSSFSITCATGYETSPIGSIVVATCTQFNATFSDWIVNSSCSCMSPYCVHDCSLSES